MRCVTAYQPSEVYNQEYCDRLGFEVIEDYRWPSWWTKMAIFEEPQDFLYADLDTIIIGEIPQPTELTLLRDFYAKPNQQIHQTGFMYVTKDAAEYAWRKWIRDPKGIMKRFRGDGDFLTSIWSGYRLWQDDYPGKVVSFKVHCADGPPDGAAAVCYHGRPRPHETGWATTIPREFMRYARHPKPCH